MIISLTNMASCPQRGMKKCLIYMICLLKYFKVFILDSDFCSPRRMDSVFI